MRELTHDSSTGPSSSTAHSNSQSQSNDEFSQSNSGSSEISGGQRDQEYGMSGGRESTQGSTPSSEQDYAQGAAGRGTDSMSQQQTAGRVGLDAYGGGAANTRS